MKTVKFNYKEYQIPEQWHDVTVGMLIKASELSDLLEDAPEIAIIHAYTGIPIHEFNKDKKTLFEIKETMKFMYTPYEPKPNTTFLLNRESYSCADDLLNQNFEDLVYVETALYNHRNEPARALPKILAILCKKDGEAMADIDLNERTKLMENLPMTYAKDVEAFFLHSLNAYRSLTLLSSTHELQKEIVLHKLQELKNTMKTHKGRSGILSGTRFRIGIWQLQLWWVEKVLVRYFNSEHSKSSKKTLKQIYKNWLSKMRRKDKSN